MKAILNYIKQFVREADKRVFFMVTVFAALLVFINYRYGLDDTIRNNSFPVKLFAWYGVGAAAFIIPYIISQLNGCIGKPATPRYIFLLLLAPFIFSLKMALHFPLKISADPWSNHYWNQVMYWPLLVLVTGSILFIIWKRLDADQPFYGWSTKGINWKPYGLMLLIMLPLVALASAQADFQFAYPKWKVIEGIYGENRISPWHTLLFELSYGSDFITIELFFRGFLILAFVKWAGKETILPMACFYCTIHFGKPLAECISSYFGGILLGIVAFNTRSILGGLMVHLGIAWMMEIAGMMMLRYS